MAKYNRKWNNPASHSKYHGLYTSWLRMLSRSKNNDGYHPSYLDVTVCERWLSYDNFFEDMIDTWFEGATLDKDIIKPGNRVYCKEYCKWVSMKENISDKNTRNINPMKRQEVVEKHKGSNSSNAKKVKNIETGEVFGSTTEAEASYSLRKASVRNAANPNSPLKTAGGYHWQYVEVK